MDESQNYDWRKSSRSFSEGNCIEVAYAADGVFVRDSKAVADRGPHLKVSATTWKSFIKSVKEGRTDL
jgi:Domain of unknown function (DUF397)